MKHFTYLISFVVVMLATQVGKTQNCAFRALPAEVCYLSSGYSHWNLEKQDLTFQVSNGGLNPITALGAYTGSSERSKVIQEWLPGGKLYCVYDGELELYFAGDQAELEALGFQPFDEAEAAEFTIYGMDTTTYDYGSTTMTLSIAGGNIGEVIILATTLGMPIRHNVAPVVYNDKVEIPAGSIFAIHWTLPGDNDCQAFDYSFRFLY